MMSEMKNKITRAILIVSNVVILIGLGFLLRDKFNIFQNVLFPKSSQIREIKNLIGKKYPKKRILHSAKVFESKKLEEGIIRKKYTIGIEKYPEKARRFAEISPEISQVRCYLFHPEDTSEKYPAIIIFPGHVKSVSEEAVTRDAYLLARNLAKNGFVSCTISFADMEKGVFEFENHKDRTQKALLEGRPIHGVRVWAGVRIIDYVIKLDYVDSEKIGVAGKSMGGHVATYVAAIDERVKSLVNAAYFLSYNELPLKKELCVCNYIPEMVEEYDFPVVASLIAPRPALYIIGKNDKHSSLNVSEQLMNKIVKPEYEKLKKTDNVKFYIHDGGHEMKMQEVVDWFKKTLKEDK
jgi:dienelactone hydrolase